MDRSARKARSRRDRLTGKAHRLRAEAEKASTLRYYCDAFALWRTCRFKPCRKARRCCGDESGCLHRGLAEVPRDLQWKAREKLLQMTPPNSGAAVRAAREPMPSEYGSVARPICGEQAQPG